MTTQARPDWNAEMERQIKATESAMALAKDYQNTADKHRETIEKLRDVLRDIRRLANQGDVNIQPLLGPIADMAGVALEKTK